MGLAAGLLVESERDASGKLCGYTDRYLRVLFDGQDSLKGNLVGLLLEEAQSDKMRGAADGC